ncbi:MAG: hypothetical protein II072_08220 [Clostridia bacterium]|nr:hypothetical protein [Clostridia bacterium]MBQ2191132.1 hypothetical protein [Clostridia bacterium]MBQ5487910.1 hypothetical protein [Clostridia bacterium]
MDPVQRFLTTLEQVRQKDYATIYREAKGFFDAAFLSLVTSDLSSAKAVLGQQHLSDAVMAHSTIFETLRVAAGVDGKLTAKEMQLIRDLSDNSGVTDFESVKRSFMDVPDTVEMRNHYAIIDKLTAEQKALLGNLAIRVIAVDKEINAAEINHIIDLLK